MLFLPCLTDNTFKHTSVWKKKHWHSEAKNILSTTSLASVLYVGWFVAHATKYEKILKLPREYSMVWYLVTGTEDIFFVFTLIKIIMFLDSANLLIQEIRIRCLCRAGAGMSEQSCTVTY